MPTYSAADIIGKTLIAKKNINVVKSAKDSAKVAFVVKPGQSVGTVVSYLLPNADRKSLYWVFYTTSKIPYYVAHKEGLFDLKVLKDSGVKTTEEKTEEETSKNQTFGDKALQTLQKVALWGIVSYFGFKLGSIVLNKKLK